MTETILKPSTAGAPGQHQTFLGGSLVLRGELSGDEDLTIEGQFDGTINLQGHCLTVGQHGQVKADIAARQVSVSGKLNGKINALEKISIQRTGNVVGDLVSAGVAIEEGAYFKGSIEILRDGERPASQASISRPTVQATATSKA
ncbi:MAG: bactofilin family protein [Terriglobia bacterium]